jgi:hypothetical protein
MFYRLNFNVFGSNFDIKTSISANILNNNAFPSITGLKLQAHISLKLLYHFVITATRFCCIFVNIIDIFAISKHGSATPGE